MDTIPLRMLYQTGSGTETEKILLKLTSVTNWYVGSDTEKVPHDLYVLSAVTNWFRYRNRNKGLESKMHCTSSVSDTDTKVLEM